MASRKIFEASVCGIKVEGWTRPGCGDIELLFCCTALLGDSRPTHREVISKATILELMANRIPSGGGGS